MAKGKAEGKRRTSHTIANAASIVFVFFLAGISVIGIFGEGENVIMSEMLFVAMPLAFVMLIFVIKATENHSSLAFFVPLVLFALNLLMLLTNESHVSFFLFISFLLSGISALYANLRQTLAYIFTQALIIGAMHFSGTSIANYDSTLAGHGIYAIYLFCCFFLLVIAKTATVDLKLIAEEADSFRTYLTTTQSNLAMLDSSNRVLYASQTMSKLASIENPDLARGRPFVDLFPNRELKYLACRMLDRRELHEDTCEFTKYGQKRYFKAFSNRMVGRGKTGTLVTMLDMTFLAERDEIAAMKDSLKIGIFFMDKQTVIKENYSRHLEELLADGDLAGKRFIDLLRYSLAPKELDSLQDYLDMVFDRSFDADTLRDVNPLTQLQYVDKLGFRKIFNCTFFSHDPGKGEGLIFVTIYDITASVELRERLKNEEKKRRDEMANLFELLKVDPATFEVFQDEMEHEFARIDDIMGDGRLSNHEILVEVFQLVHAIKSNAVTLGLGNFGAKVHEVEAEIKKLRNIEGEVPFDDMLHLTIEIEKLVQEKNGFRVTLDKINAFKHGSKKTKPIGENPFLESLVKTAEKVAEDMEKKVRFVAANVDMDALEKGPKRVIKEVLIQLIRNSVAHGVETPEERVSKGKEETATIRLSVKLSGERVHVRLTDDGKGFDFDGIREKAVSQNFLKEQEANDRKRLMEVIFSPGFSTAEADGIHAGRGMGLNLVRDRVRDACGTIKLQTEFGKGTVFSIFFPVEAAGETDKDS